jgi:hypothetical protein
MKTIETRATVTAEGKLIVPVPPDIPPGEHRVVVVIEENMVHEHSDPIEGLEASQGSLDLPIHECGPWPADLTLRRQELYGEWER